MKALLVVLILGMMTSMSFADNEKGNGGSGAEIEVTNARNMIINNILKTERFLRENKVAREVFSEVDSLEFTKVVMKVIENDGIKIIKDGDEENDNEDKTHIRDKHNNDRTAVNYSELGIIEYDLEELQKLKDKPEDLFVLNFHEFLGLMGLDIDVDYEISSRLSKFVTKIAEYDLVALSSCDLKIVGNMYGERFELVKEIVESKGYRLVDNMADFKLDINGISGFLQEGDVVQVEASLVEIENNKLIYTEKSTSRGFFAIDRWNMRIRKVLKKLPLCR